MQRLTIYSTEMELKTVECSISNKLKNAYVTLDINHSDIFRCLSNTTKQESNIPSWPILVGIFLAFSLLVYSVVTIYFISKSHFTGSKSRNARVCEEASESEVLRHPRETAETVSQMKLHSKLLKTPFRTTQK